MIKEEFKNFIESFEVYCKLTNKNIMIKKTKTKEKYINYYIDVFNRDVIFKVSIVNFHGKQATNSISIYILDDSIFFESITSIIPENKKIISSLNFYAEQKNISHPHYVDKITSNHSSCFFHHIFSFYSEESFYDFFSENIIKKI